MPSNPGGVDPYEPLPPDLDPRGRHRGNAARLHGFKLVGGTALVLISVSLLILAGYEWYTFRDINNKVTKYDLQHVGAAPAGKQVDDGEDQNILLVGNDDRSNMTRAEVHKLKVGRDGGSMSTDSMMLVHVPANGSKATLISLPRDAYVKIPGHGKNKLNAAYVFGYNDAKGSKDERRAAGADLLIETVSNLTGLTIDHYIQVSLMGFYDIADAIGGIPVNLCHAVNDTVAYNQSIGSDGGSGFKMSAGKHNLNAVQALEFVRQRHNLPRGDIDRVRRQQYFLTAAFRKVASIGFLFKLAKLGDALERNVFTDKGLNLIDLARQMEDLSANNIIGKTIPFQRFADVDVGSVEIVSPARIRNFMDRVIQGSTSTHSSHPKKTHSATSSAGPKPLDSHCIN
ncbi:MAG TPA: LCP family protein [Jatrophihabitans sp.]|nr:LCP family protein [Jatrophihabitans sp.]